MNTLASIGESLRLTITVPSGPLAYPLLKYLSVFKRFWDVKPESA
jgi:hypothetical protein